MIAESDVLRVTLYVFKPNKRKNYMENIFFCRHTANTNSGLGLLNQVKTIGFIWHFSDRYKIAMHTKYEMMI